MNRGKVIANSSKFRRRCRATARWSPAGTLLLAVVVAAGLSACAGPYPTRGGPMGPGAGGRWGMMGGGSGMMGGPGRMGGPGMYGG